MIFAEEDCEMRADMCRRQADALFEEARKIHLKRRRPRKARLLRAAYRLAARIHRIDRSQSFASGAKYPGMAKLRRDHQKKIDRLCVESDQEGTCRSVLAALRRQCSKRPWDMMLLESFREAARDYCKATGWKLRLPRKRKGD